MTLEVGAKIGRYEIIGLLGQGGMASVYKARQPALDRFVAIKVLRPSLAEDPEFRERFEREARAAGQLRHPRIVEVFDFDSVDGRYFMAMECVEGATLKERLTDLAQDERRPPPREIARIVGEVAEGLAYAHEHGVVHRDIKPSNIMLTTNGHALVADFGIAKLASSTQYTRTGTGIGTPEYMSPEQAQGLPTGPSSDIYSLAVVAYEMFVGRVPFSAESPLATALKHIRDEIPRPSTLGSSVGPVTEEVLLRGLAKVPSDRHATTVEFAEALQGAVVADEGSTFATIRRPAQSQASLVPLGPVQRRVRWLARRRGRLLAAAGVTAVAASMAAYLLTVGGATPATAGTIRVLDGSPEILARGRTQYEIATTGTSLAPGDRLRLLGSAQAEVLLFEGSSVLVQPSTELQLLRAERSGDGIASMDLRTGDTIYRPSDAVAITAAVGNSHAERYRVPDDFIDAARGLDSAALADRRSGSDGAPRRGRAAIRRSRLLGQRTRRERRVLRHTSRERERCFRDPDGPCLLFRGSGPTA